MALSLNDHKRAGTTFRIATDNAFGEKRAIPIAGPLGSLYRGRGGWAVGSLRAACPRSGPVVHPALNAGDGTLAAQDKTPGGA